MVCSNSHRNGRPFVLSFRVIARLLSRLRNSLLLDQSKSWVSFVFCTTSCGNMVGKCHFYMYYRGLFTQGRKRSLFSRYEFKMTVYSKKYLSSDFWKRVYCKGMGFQKGKLNEPYSVPIPFCQFFWHN